MSNDAALFYNPRTVRRCRCFTGLTMRNRTVILLAAVAISLGAFTGAAAFPGSPADLDTPSPAGSPASLSPIELRAANAAAASGQAVKVIPLETNLGEYQFIDYWRLIDGPVPVYDAPNGNPIGAIEPGFNFVSVMAWEGNEWAMINWNQWVPAQHLKHSEASPFAGMLIPEQPDRPFGWMLLDTRPSVSPAGPQDTNAPYLLRYTPITVYATVQVDGWNWYLIGQDQWIEQKRVALVHPVARPEGVKGRWVAVDLYEQVAVAYEGDAMVFVTLVSSGLPDWPTREGLFQVWSRVERGKMSGAEGRPDYYYLQDVPWTMYFDEDRSLHGTYWHDGFGYRHSHGCVNLSITDAAWLYQWTEDQEVTWVYVYSSGQYIAQ